MLTAVVGAVSANAGGGAQKRPKPLRGLPDHGHAFSWAYETPSHPMLAGCSLGLDVPRQRSLRPKTEQQLEFALSACEPTRLLSNFEFTSTSVVSTFEFSPRYTQLLSKLVAAVSSQPSRAEADHMATDLLWHSMQHAAEDSMTSRLSKLNRVAQAWTAVQGSPMPQEPSGLLLALAKAHLVRESLGDSTDRKYRDHLSDRYDMSSLDSMPGTVLRAAIQHATHKYPSGTPQHVAEVKSLVRDWVSTVSRDADICRLLAPLVVKLDDVGFDSLSLHAWEEQFTVFERSTDGALAPLRLALGRASKPRAPRVPAQPVNPTPSVHGVVDAGSTGTAVVPSPAAPSGNVAPSPPSVPALPSASGAEIAGLRGDLQHLANVVLAQQQGAVLAQQHGATLPRPPLPPAALSPTLQQHFVPAQPQVAAASVGPPGGHFAPPAAYSAASPPTLARAAKATLGGRIGMLSKAFSVPPGKMNEAWVAEFGIPGMPPPSLPNVQRPWLQWPQICEVCDVDIPAGFVDEPHTGGPTCPGCQFIGLNQGLGEMKFFLHPSDPSAPAKQAPKPPGRANQYVHQVFKCGWGLAIIHVAARIDRDSGKGDALLALFQSRQQ